MKSYTNLEQSKKLAEILPIESADMFYRDNGIDVKLMWEHNAQKVTTPCWSLAALLNVIPQEIFDGEYILNITEGCDNRWVLTYDGYEDRTKSYYGLSSGADNLVDACVAMIEKLNKLQIL